MDESGDQSGLQVRVGAKSDLPLLGARVFIPVGYLERPTGNLDYMASVLLNQEGVIAKSINSGASS